MTLSVALPVATPNCTVTSCQLAAPAGNTIGSDDADSNARNRTHDDIRFRERETVIASQLCDGCAVNLPRTQHRVRPSPVLRTEAVLSRSCAKHWVGEDLGRRGLPPCDVLRVG